MRVGEERHEFWGSRKCEGGKRLAVNGLVTSFASRPFGAAVAVPSSVLLSDEIMSASGLSFRDHSLPNWPLDPAAVEAAVEL